MLKLAGSFLALSSLLQLASAQSGAWGQCGGTGWTGATTCVSGYTCTYQNAYYSQCLPGTAATSTTKASSSSAATTTTKVSSTSVASSTASGSALPTATSTTKLNTAAKAAGKTYFGSATDNGELTDTAYVAGLNDTGNFGAITPGNSMKWDATEKSRGVFTFSGGDVIANLAKANGQLLRGHTCVWHNQLPSWVTSGNFSAADLTSIVQTHCSTVVGHYKGQAYAWDVVNEPFNEDGTYRTSVFYNTLNTAYFATALKAARAADPAAKLYINEYNLEYNGAKAQGMLALAKQLLADGVPLDGIGFQGHLIVGSVPTAIQAALQSYADLGLDVAITELDIRMTLPATAALYAQQKTDYQNVIKACKAVTRCVGVTIWDYTDKYSWIPSVFSGQGAALPWDANLVKKPAYDGIVAGWAT